MPRRAACKLLERFGAFFLGGHTQCSDAGAVLPEETARVVQSLKGLVPMFRSCAAFSEFWAFIGFDFL